MGMGRVTGMGIVRETAKGMCRRGAKVKVVAVRAEAMAEEGRREGRGMVRTAMGIGRAMAMGMGRTTVRATCSERKGCTADKMAAHCRRPRPARPWGSTRTARRSPRTG
jgi:hypothetical protein